MSKVITANRTYSELTLEEALTVAAAHLMAGARIVEVVSA